MRHADVMNLRQRRERVAAAEIGPIPAVADLARRAEASASLRRFCELYYPGAFNLEWSEDQLKVLARLEAVVLAGGQFALAMPRKSGKSALTRTAALWAVLTGRRRYVAFIAATAKMARDQLDFAVKALQVEGGFLAADFPEASRPIICLNRVTQRQQAQTHAGLHTCLEWGRDRVVFPTVQIDTEMDGFDGPTRIVNFAQWLAMKYRKRVEYLDAAEKSTLESEWRDDQGFSVMSGAVLTACGLTGGDVRGQTYQLPNGTILCPDMAIADDPQTRTSAKSRTQTDYRQELLNGDVLCMGGPGTKIAGICLCTVIYQDDLAWQILDREKSPNWQGEKFKMIYAFPTNEKLWQEYRRRREGELREGGDGAKATAFYKARRKAMDSGAKAAWPARFDPDELSAVQHAMDLKFRDEAAFMAEFQNEPMTIGGPEEEMLRPDQIAAKTNSHARGLVPSRCQILTAFIDVHDRLLYWMVCGWQENFTGYVVDYGAYPDQRLLHFAMRNARATLAHLHPGVVKEEAKRLGLEALAKALLGREWRREDGAVMRLDRLLIDRGDDRDVVESVCRRVGGVLMPNLGQPVGPHHRPMSEYRRTKPGERIGHYWWLPSVAGTSEIRHVRADVNYWKSFIHARLAAGLAEAGSLSLFGKDAAVHRLLAEHLTAERRVPTMGRGRRVDVWMDRVKGGDNHWLDCLVGCAVAASLQGAALEGLKTAAGSALRPRRRWTQADLRRRK
jgi:hypothetical protein